MTEKVVLTKQFLENYRTKPDKVLQALEILDAAEDVTVKTLQATGIALTVSSFRKTEGPVGKLATKLRKKWKAMYEEKMDKSEQNVLVKVKQEKQNASNTSTSITSSTVKQSRSHSSDRESSPGKLKSFSECMKEAAQVAKERREGNTDAKLIIEKERTNDEVMKPSMSSSNGGETCQTSKKMSIKMEEDIQSDSSNHKYKYPREDKSQNVLYAGEHQHSKDESDLKRDKINKHRADKSKHSRESSIRDHERSRENSTHDHKHSRESSTHDHKHSRESSTHDHKHSRDSSTNDHKHSRESSTHDRKHSRETSTLGHKHSKDSSTNDLKHSRENSTHDHKHSREISTHDHKHSRESSTLGHKRSKDSSTNDHTGDVKRPKHEKSKHHSDGKSHKLKKHKKHAQDKHTHAHSTTSEHTHAHSTTSGNNDGLSFEDVLSGNTLPPAKKKKTNSNSTVRGPSSSTSQVVQPPLPGQTLSALPELTTEYKPLPRVHQGFESRRAQPAAGVQYEPELFTGSKSYARTAVYSGRRKGGAQLQSLYQLSLLCLMNNIDELGYVGGVPYDILKPVLERCTPTQLFCVEDYNPEFTQESDDLWQNHCNKDFKGKSPDEFESWRELYLRLHEEREKRLVSLTAKLAGKQQKTLEGASKAKTAYTSVCAPKPPREVLRQQKKYGTASGSKESAARAAMRMREEQRSFTARINSGFRGPSSASVSSSTTTTTVPGNRAKTIAPAPLMKKTKRFLSKLHR